MTLGGLAMGLRLVGLVLFTSGLALRIGEGMVAGMVAMWVAEMCEPWPGN